MRLIGIYGIDAGRFAELAGTLSSKGMDPKSRLSTDIADAFFKQAIEMIPDPAFGLRASECWHPSNLGALGYAWLSSASLHIGFDRFILYSRILGQKSSFQCVECDNSLRYTYINDRENSSVRNVMTDFSLSILIDMCRKNAGVGFHPNLVSLRRQTQQNTAPYIDFFGCAVNFGADEDSFVIDRHVADSPLPSSNHEIAITFDAILAEQLAALDKSDVVARCKAYLLQQMTSGEASEQDLANAMGMSLRTLQRKLTDVETTYKTLLDELRHDLAIRYLADSQRTVTEITFLLGFSEQSAFTRAFKRWNGNTPSAYREEYSSLN